MKIVAGGVAVVDQDQYLSRWVEQYARLDVHQNFLERFQSHIPIGGTVCDIGACLGSYATTYARFVGPMGIVHAFEPNPIAYECLQHNVRGFSQVTVHPIGLWSKRANGTVLPNLKNLGNTAIALDVRGQVQLLPLDEIAAEWTRLDFIKIDVEGAEPDVLEGATWSIKRWKPAMLIEINRSELAKRGRDSWNILRRLDALGYTYTCCRPGDTLEMAEIDILCVPNK